VTTFAYTLEILGDGTTPVGTPLPVPPPWQRLLEALRWRNFCAGRRLDPARVEIAPVWHSSHGRPFIEGVGATDGDGGQRIAIGTTVYSPDARRASSRLVLEKLLEEGQSYSYRVAAHPAPAGTAPRLEEILDDYPVTEAEGNERDASSTRPETGGVLFGRLTRQTAATSKPYLDITFLSPAEAGRAAHDSFQFTPGSWNRAREHLAERNENEVFAGWFHSHPDFCNPECPPEKRAVCPLRKPFFSNDDILLHETIFPAAWSVGLLVADSGDTRIPALFGWRDGMVRRRGFHIIND